MSEIAQELLKRADVIGEWLSGAVTKTADVATAQAIDIAMQYVMYGRFFFTSVIVASTFASVALVWYFFTKGVNNTDAVVRSPNQFRDGDWLAERIVAFFIGGPAAAASLIVLTANLKEFLMVWAAPKVWLMIQLAELAKQVK